MPLNTRALKQLQSLRKSGPYVKKQKVLRDWMQDMYDIPAERLAEVYPASLGKMNTPMLSDEADTLLLRDAQRSPIDQDRFGALIKKYGVKPEGPLWRGSRMEALDDLHKTTANSPSEEAKWLMPFDSAQAAAGYMKPYEKMKTPLLMQMDVDDSMRAIPGWHFGFDPKNDMDQVYIDMNKADGTGNELEWIIPKGSFVESPRRIARPPEFGKDPYDKEFIEDEVGKKALERLVTLRMKLKQKARGGSVRSAPGN